MACLAAKQQIGDAPLGRYVIAHGPSIARLPNAAWVIYMTSRLQAADESIGLLSDRKVIILQHRRDVIFSARMAHAQRFSLRRLTFKVQVLPAYSIFYAA